MEDVALAAGVSKAAVSSYLSGRLAGQGGRIGIGPGKRKLILEAARRLRYRPPSPQALLKIYPEEGHYCFLMHRRARDGFDAYFADILRGVVEALGRDSLNINLAQFEDDIDYLECPAALPYAIQSGMTTKYILVGQPNYSLLMAIMQRGYQPMYLSRLISTPGIASAAPDYEMASYLGTRRLLEAGHRRIRIAAECYWSQDARGYHAPKLIAGATRAMREGGLVPADEQLDWFVPTAPEPADPAETYAALLRDPKTRPTGVFCFCDYTAHRLMRAANALGIQVPRQLSVVGCQDKPLSRELSPALTTISFPLAAMGQLAVEHFKRIDRGETPERNQYVLPVHLVDRASVAPPLVQE